MVDIDKAVISRLKKSGQWYEVLVDPVKTLEFKKGKKLTWMKFSLIQEYTMM